jgi:hypothetical protein
MDMAENCKSVKKMQKVRPNISLESLTKILKMRHFGHVMRAHQSLEKYIKLGITAGARKKGSPVCGGWRYHKCNCTLSKLLNTVSERQKKVALLNNLAKKRKRANGLHACTEWKSFSSRILVQVKILL